MSEMDEFEVALSDRLHRKADGVEAPPRSVGTIVRRSHRRRVRHRAAGALAGAGALALGAAVVTRPGLVGELDLATGGGSGTSTTSPGTVPGTTSPVDPSETTVVTRPGPAPAGTPDTTAPDRSGGVALVPDPNATGLLANDLRIDIDPARSLADGTQITVRGSGFPAGAQVLLIECTTHGLAAAALADAVGYCDVGTRWDVFPPADAEVDLDGPTPDVGADGTFTARYNVRRNVSTMGGAFDCALGGLSADAGDQLRELLDAGTLGAASFPPGVFGCSVVAVVTGSTPQGDGSSVETYRSATAHILHFDPNATAVAPTTTTTSPLPRCDDPPPDYVGRCQYPAPPS